VNREFRVGSKIDYGNNSVIFKGINVHTGEDVAIKLEAIRGCKKSRGHLANEANVYRSLAAGHQGTSVRIIIESCGTVVIILYYLN
jgi:hypothetical protein